MNLLVLELQVKKKGEDEDEKDNETAKIRKALSGAILAEKTKCSMG